jgi:glycosyltransferase involved in cell wall biosynthesis
VPGLVKRFYPWADHVVGNSEGVARNLRSVIGEGRGEVCVIYNPIVVPGLRARAAACPGHPWLTPGQPSTVLAVGRLTAQKDFPALIHAFADLRRLRTARLIILGEGPDRATLEQLIARLYLQADVSLPGFVPNPYAWLARASVFVLSSRWEGLPTVLVEALFCGVPVVATDCPSGPREILRDGRHGTLVPVGDRAALTRAMGRALDGDAVRPAPESWRPYELDSIVDQYLHLLLGSS